jgi:hypothetical protein
MYSLRSLAAADASGFFGADGGIVAIYRTWDVVRKSAPVVDCADGDEVWRTSAVGLQKAARRLTGLRDIPDALPFDPPRVFFDPILNYHRALDASFWSWITWMIIMRNLFHHQHYCHDKAVSSWTHSAFA